MEQMIYIKYINNLINLTASEENSDSNSKILQLEILKNKIVFLLDTNQIFLFDTKNEKFIKKDFLSKSSKSKTPIRLLKVYSDQIFIILDTYIHLLDEITLEITKSWDVGEKLYYFTLFEEFNNYNLEIIYVNDQNELKFYSKGYLFDAKYRNLYKENVKIDKLLFQNGYLLWSSNFTMKVFDLERKKMVMRKSFEGFLKNEERRDEFMTVDYWLFENLLCINLKGKLILVYKFNNEGSLLEIQAPKNNNENGQMLPTSRVQEIFRSEELTEIDDYYLGCWLNSSLTKISMLKSKKHINLTNHHEISSVVLEIFKLSFSNQNHNSPNKANNYVNEMIYSKDFPYIISSGNFAFSFSQKYSIVYIYDCSEIYFVSIYDKSTKIFDDLKRNINFVSNFNDIYNIYNKLNNFNEKCYIVNKIVRNLNLLLNSSSIDQSKILYIINSVITNEKMLNYITIILLQIKHFEICYNWLSKTFLKIRNETKERVIRYLLENKKYEVLIKFLLDGELLEISDEFNKFLLNLANDSEDDNLIYIYSLVNLKIENYQKSIEFLLKLKYCSKVKEVFDILLKFKCEELIFTFKQLFLLFNEEQLLQIIDSLFNKDYEVKLCEKFYDILIEDNRKSESDIEFGIDNNSVVFNFLIKIIEKEKFYLIINNKLAEIIFGVLLNNNVLNLLIKFLNNYDKLDYAKILKKYDKNLNEDSINTPSNNINRNSILEVLIIILNFTQDYERIINIYLEKYRDPEKAIDFIENLNQISDFKKEDLYAYLKNKIKESNFLSSAKKLYFINLFQDNVLEENQELLLLEELAKSEDGDDVKFIVLIMEQLKLKVKILDLSLNISQRNLEKTLKWIKKESLKGRRLNLSFVKCQFNLCENKQFEKGDEIVCFVGCLHFFHKLCFKKMNESTNTSSTPTASTDLREEISSLIKMDSVCKICSKISIE